MAHAGRAEDRLRLAGVGAVVRPHLDFLRHDATVLAETEPHPVAHRHARVAREEFLLAAVNELDRAPALAGEEGTDHGGIVVTGLAAETSANLGLDHAHLGFGEPERGGVAAACEKGGLRVAPHCDAVVVPFCDAADGLERCVPLARGFPGALDDEVGCLEAGFHIATLEAEVVRNVAGRVVVNQRGAGGERLVEREHGGQHFVLDHDLVHGRACRFRIQRGDRSHLIADVADFPDRERIEVRTEGAPFAFRRVGAGCDCFHAGHGRGGAGIDREDASVRVRAPQHRRVQHSGKMQVGDVLRRASDLRNGVGARNVLADDEEAAGGRHPGIQMLHAFPLRASVIASL